MKKKEKNHSKNERAEKLVGKRIARGNPIDLPCELDYWCPICKIEVDEGLQWSEYNGFLWCEKCNLDIPSALCKKNTKDGIKVYLDCVERLHLKQ